jgi:hypothetical protein
MLDKIFNFFSGSKEITTAKSFDKKWPLSRQLRRYNYRIEADMKKYKDAVIMAEDPIMPNRYLLYALYHRIMEDDQLLAQVRHARFNVQMGDFEVRKNDEAIPDLIKLFDTPWFFKYIEYCVDTEMWGYSLIEPRKGADGLVNEILIFPREHVQPLLKHILLRPEDFSGIPWNEDVLEGKLIGIGDPDDLGLLKSISKLVIRKDYNLTDWGRLNERFGIPFITMKTATTNKEELDKKEEMLENFGASGWALIDDQDEIEIKESKTSQGGHKTFEEYSNYADRCIAFLINGTTSSSEQTAYVGAAQTQERTVNKYTLARMRRIQYHINWELFPFLQKYFDYPLDGAKFVFTDLEYNEEEEAITASTADTSTPGTTGAAAPEEKKK